MSEFSADDHAFMARALRLAERGLYTTRPNPMVGCVLVANGEVVAEDYHRRAGEPHAEALALQAAGERARGATAYVTLEPCAHQGRTPPCADALIAAGVARVVAATRDSYEQVDGAGIAKLRDAGIAVDTGLMEMAARELNRGFFSRVERGRPWLRIKLGMSLDGRTALASGESKWITSEASRADVQHWRARSGALLTASGTVLADDPLLTVRMEGIEVAAPLRVVLDPGLATVARGRVRDGTAPTLYLHASGARAPKGFAGAELAAIPKAGEGKLDLGAAMQELGRRGINEVQVEAGATLGGALLQAGLVDELLLYVAPVLLGDSARPLFGGLDVASMQDRLGWRVVDARRIGDDHRFLLRPAPQAA